MAVYEGQSSYDPRFIRKLMPEMEIYKEGALAKLFDIDPDNLDHLPQEKYKLFEECSPITHLTKDDPPAMLIYRHTMQAPITNQSIGIHHPRFGKVLKEKMDALGIECRVYAGPPRPGENRETTVEFLKRHFELKQKESASVP